MNNLNSTEVPPGVLCEFLGQIQFSKDQEEDVQLAEQIAANTYGSINDLIDVCRGYVEVKKRDFEKLVKSIPDNPFYNKYYVRPSK